MVSETKKNSLILTRREVTKGMIGAGSAIALASAFNACKKSHFNESTGVKGSASDGALVAQGPFLEQWMKTVAANGDSDGRSRYLTLLLGAWLRSNALGLIQEFQTAGVRTLSAGVAGPIIFSSYPSVKKALNTPLEYSVRKPKKEMDFLGARFILSETIPAKHDFERRIMDQVFKADDEKLLSGIVSGILTGLNVAPQRGQSFDLVKTIARKVPLQTVSKYFGIPMGDQALSFEFDPAVTPMGNAPSATTPSTQAERDKQAAHAAMFYPNFPTTKQTLKPTYDDMYTWTAAGFKNFFLNPAGDPGIKVPGRQFGTRVMVYVSEAVKQRRLEITNGATLSDKTLVDRFLAMEKDSDKLVFFTPEVIVKQQPDSSYVKNGRTIVVPGDISRNIYPPLSITSNPGTSSNVDIDTKGYTNEYQQISAAALMAPADERIAVNLAAPIFAANVTVEEAICNVVDYLLCQKKQGNSIPYSAAKTAAAAGDYNALRRICEESLRFKPQAEVLLRYLEKNSSVDTDVLQKDAAGKVSVASKKSQTVNAGAIVFACVGSAMVDKNESQFKDLDKFSVNPAERPDNLYANFGNFGQDFDGTSQRNHRCIGYTMAIVQISEVLKFLFKLGDIEIDASGYDQTRNTGLKFAENNKSPFVSEMLIKIV